MRSHRNLHHLLGIENSEVSPRDNVVALGRGLGMGLSAGGDGGGSSGGTGLYASGKGLSAGCDGCGLVSGGKLSKIGQAFNKAFNPKKNGLASSAVKVGDKLKTAVVHTYNQAYHDIEPVVNKTISGTENVADKINQGWHKTFNPKTGQAIVSDLKTGARYVIPAATSALGALAGTALSGGDPLGGIAGSAAGAYAGYRADKALGIAGNNDFVGAGVKRRRKRKSKGKGVESDSSSSSESDTDSDSESETGKGIRRKRKSKGGTIKDTLDKKVWKKIPKVFHKPLEDIGVASLEYAGFKIPPKKKLIAEDKKLEEGAGFKKGSKSKTRKSELDFMTHKGDKDYHRGGHDEDMPSADGVEGGKLKKHKKGSPEAMEWGRKMKEARMKKKGMSGGGIDNNTPKSNAVRISPYQNF